MALSAKWHRNHGVTQVVGQQNNQLVMMLHTGYHHTPTKGMFPQRDLVKIQYIATTYPAVSLQQNYDVIMTTTV